MHVGLLYDLLAVLLYDLLAVLLYDLLAVLLYDLLAVLLYDLLAVLLYDLLAVYWGGKHHGTEARAVTVHDILKGSYYKFNFQGSITR